MAPGFENRERDDANLDFKRFLSALSSGSEPPPTRDPGGRPSEDKDAHKRYNHPSTESIERKKNLFTRRTTMEHPSMTPRRKVSQHPTPPSSHTRSQVRASKSNDRHYLMGTREKSPDLPYAQETAFLPRMDGVSHPRIEQQIKKPPRKKAEKHRHRKGDTASLRDTGSLVPDEPSHTSGEDRIALSHISVRPKFTLEQILETMIRENASDLHIATAHVPTLRISGELVRMELPDLDKELTENLLLPILTEEQRSIFEQEGDADFSFDYLDKARFRINYYRHHWGIGAAFRLIPMEIPRLHQLGLPAVLKNLLRLKKGLIVLTGPAGSGKSTTIASMLEEVNSSRKLRIITVENPIEYVLESKMSLVSQREIGTSANNFSDALFAVLREDPDIIMVSEIWDPEDIRQVLKISETGHLVITSVRTTDCTKAVERLVDAFPYDEQEQIKVILSESLAGIIAQQLIPRADGRGRVLASEILLATQGLVTTIRESKFFQIPSIIQTGRELGMQTMDQSLLDLIEKKLITPNAAKALATDHRFFKRMGIRFDE